MSKRPKIFCQFGSREVLEPVSGDRINEIKFYRALSSFADVYYNDVLIDWKSKVLGDPLGLNVPSRDYDLYYVRNNAELFSQLPHPKVTMAYPYDEEAFGKADGLIVTTNAWADLLHRHSESAVARKKVAKWYPEKIVLPAAIINVQQTIDPTFLQRPSEKQIFYWQARMTGARAFGYFGRITEVTLPNVLFEGLKIIEQRLGSVADPLAVCAGSIRTELPSGALQIPTIQYSEMPSVLCACYGTFASVGEDSGVLGSGKILESIATGTPVICEANPVRVEQLGSEYPGSYTRPEEALDILWRTVTEPGFYRSLVDWALQRRTEFTPDATGRKIQKRLASANLL